MSGRVRGFSMWPRLVASGLVRCYQVCVSPLLPRRCRFYPTCSEYARESLMRYGLIRGGFMAARRVSRCHPWNPGGYDPVK